jgi:hypothetical protein
MKAPPTLDSWTIREAHRVMVSRIIKESSIEAILDLVSDHAIDFAGFGNERPTIKQARFRRLGPSLAQAIEAAVKERI